MLTEEVYGYNIIGYHRTNVRDLVNIIGKEGYDVGYRNGGFYGRGLYATYDLQSQQRDDMIENYGKYIIKVSFKMPNVFFCDWEPFSVHPMKKKKIEKWLDEPINEFYFIRAQLIYWDFYSSDTSIMLDKEMDEILEYVDKTGYSSVLAKYLYDVFDIEKVVDGMLFTGETDGRVIVSYHPDKHAIPFAVSTDKYGLKSFKMIKTIRQHPVFKRIMKSRINID